VSLEAVFYALNRMVLGNPIAQWLVAGALAAAVLVGLIGVRTLLGGFLARQAAKTSNAVDDLLAKLILGTRTAFAIALALLVAVLSLQLPERFETVVIRAVVTVAAIQGGLWGMIALEHAIAEFARRRHEPAIGSAMGILRVIGVVLVWAFVLLVVLANLGIDVTAAVAGLGVGGVAVALATQNILGDLFASLSIVLDRPFVVGDLVAVGDFVGNVEQIGLKTTRIRSIQGEQLVFSNSDLLQSRIRNLQTRLERRAKATIGVSYDTPPAMLAKLPGLFRAIVEAQPRVRFERSHLTEVATSAFQYEVEWCFLGPEYLGHLDAQQAILLGIVDMLAREGVTMPYPTQTVELKGRGTAAGPTA
jgi:small-conductance mechanosensitive channel